MLSNPNVSPVLNGLNKTVSDIDIIVLYSYFPEPLPETQFQQYLNFLSEEQKEKNKCYIRWQDRHAHLLGKLLLKKGFEWWGETDFSFSDLVYNSYNRPCVSGSMDFNISHSGNYVICAVGKNLRLGIDIEEIKEIDFDDFTRVMSGDQWSDILHNKEPLRSFFKYWTWKESVIKGDGRGLAIPLEDIYIDGNQAIYESRIWYLHELSIDRRKYISCLATDKQNFSFEARCVDFYPIELL